MPRFDLERFGILLKRDAAPRRRHHLHRPITRQNRDRVVRIYEQVPDPKFVVAVGACAIVGLRLPRRPYNSCGGIDQVLRQRLTSRLPIRPDALIDAWSSSSIR